MSACECGGQGYFLRVDGARGVWLPRLCKCMKQCCEDGLVEFEKDGYDYVAPCPKCAPARDAVRKLTMARLPSQHDPTASKPRSRQQAYVMKVLRRWVKAYKTGSVGFTIQGPVGTGKSYCLACCSQALVQRHRVPLHYQTLTGLWSAMRKLMGDGKLNPEQHLHKLCEVEVLALDEVIGPRTDWQQEVLQHLLTERYDGKRTTIMTTNLDGEDLMKALGDGIDAERIVSRLGQWAPTIELNGADLRAG